MSKSPTKKAASRVQSNQALLTEAVAAAAAPASASDDSDEGKMQQRSPADRGKEGNEEEDDDADQSGLLFDMMETAADDTGIDFRGVLPLSDITERGKLEVMRHLETRLASDGASAIRSLAWLAVTPGCLEFVRTEPEPLVVHMHHVMMTLGAWLLFLVSSSLLLVTAFLQVPRMVSYIAGGSLGAACIAFAIVAFTQGHQELAGALTAPVLPPVAMRTLYTMHHWLQLIGTSREDLQDLIN